LKVPAKGVEYSLSEAGGAGEEVFGAGDPDVEFASKRGAEVDEEGSSVASRGGQ